MHQKHDSVKIKILQLAMDLLVVITLIYIFLWIHIPTVPKNLDGLWIFTHSQYKSLGLLTLSWLLIASQNRFYGPVKYFSDRVRKIIFQISLFAIVLFAVSGIKTDYLYTNAESAVFIGILTVYLFVSRAISWGVHKRSIEAGPKNKDKIIIVGKNNNTSSFIDLMTNKIKEYEVISCMVVEPDDEIETSFNTEKLKNLIQTEKVDRIFISMFNNLPKKVNEEVITLAEKNYIPFEFIPKTYLKQYDTFNVKYYDTFPLFTLEDYPLDGMWNRVFKRAFDIVFSLLVIIFVLSWLYPLIALFIVMDSGFPILYKQKRNGMSGIPFNCLKFRSMRPSKDNDKKATVRGDMRITRVGQFIRKTSLDELPQFFNVLKGDMSVVGPRPHMITQDNYYTDIINKYTLRHHVRPGITGLAQIKGYRGEVNSDHDMELRIRADIFYVKNWSFWLDLMIIAQTAFKMAVGDENAI